jgi:hypothetical protein
MVTDAVSWLKRAAACEPPHGASVHRLGMLYLDGVPNALEADDCAAIAFFLQGLELDHDTNSMADCARAMAGCYAAGRGKTFISFFFFSPELRLHPFNPFNPLNLFDLFDLFNHFSF